MYVVKQYTTTYIQYTTIYNNIMYVVKPQN